MMGNEQGRATARAHAILLAWYREMGVDAAVADTAVNWLDRGDARPGAGYEISALADAEPHPPRATPRAPITRPDGPSRAAPSQTWPSKPSAQVATGGGLQNRQFPTAAPDETARAARSAARAATSIDDLAARLAAFDGCGLKATAKSLCFYRGASRARVMVIGDAPGADDDKHGAPFVGPAGQLLDKMLASIGLDQASVHLTNLVYWRPPGNRPPTAQELEACQPFLERQIEFVSPSCILLVGGVATNQLLAVPGGIARLRGKWKSIESAGRTIPTLATLHPRDLLRTPLAKRMAWRDVLSLAVALDEAKPT